jgi:hypothetical protein
VAKAVCRVVRPEMQVRDHCNLHGRSACRREVTLARRPNGIAQLSRSFHMAVQASLYSLAPELFRSVCGLSCSSPMLGAW